MCVRELRRGELIGIRVLRRRHRILVSLDLFPLPALVDGRNHLDVMLVSPIDMLRDEHGVVECLRQPNISTMHD